MAGTLQNCPNLASFGSRRPCTATASALAGLLAYAYLVLGTRNFRPEGFAPIQCSGRYGR